MKKRSLSQKLFLTYTGWFLVCMVTLTALAVGYVGSAINQNIKNTQARLISSMDENVENYFREMNAFSMELLNSSEFKKNAIIRLPEAFEEKRGTSGIFSQMYLEAYQMIQKNYNVGIAVENDYYIWLGNNYYVSEIPQECDVNTYEHMERNEKPYVKYIGKNEYLDCTAGERYKNDKDKEYITLSRSMDTQNRFVNGRAVLEVMAEAEDFQMYMEGISGSHTDGGLLVNLYDADGNVLYREADFDVSDVIKKEGSYEEKGKRVEVRRIFDGGITAVYVIDKAAYYNRLFSFLGLAFLISVVFGAIVMAITYKISKQISKPINKMCRNVQKINLEKGVYYEEVGTNIEEMEILSSTLKDMSVQLGDSLERIIALKDYETHAKMLALQAQMQPHFLFNTLTTMGAMAEEEGNTKVAAMCVNLTQMFRYIATEDSSGVKMFEEIRHVERYVNIMKERFPEAVVDIDIPLEEFGCVIPKLTIQPLVENAFKYCNRNKPWIQVKGSIEPDGRWTVEIQDNGAGFSREKIEEILEKCRESMKEEKTLSNQIDGMGLVNVYVRLKLFYGDSAIYEFEEGTSRIRIGGQIDEQ